MLKNIEEFFGKAWDWIKALWKKHDEALEDMVKAVLPMVINLAQRSDLTGDQKKQLIMAAVVSKAGESANLVAKSMVNEAVEIAVNRYGIQVGTLTKEKIDATIDSVLKAGRQFVNGKLQLDGSEVNDSPASN